MQVLMKILGLNARPILNLRLSLAVGNRRQSKAPRRFASGGRDSLRSHGRVAEFGPGFPTPAPRVVRAGPWPMGAPLTAPQQPQRGNRLPMIRRARGDGGARRRRGRGARRYAQGAWCEADGAALGGADASIRGDQVAANGPREQRGGAILPRLRIGEESRRPRPTPAPARGFLPGPKVCRVSISALRPGRKPRHNGKF